MESKGLKDLPAEIIYKINQFLPIQDKRTFREICLGDPILRLLYRDELILDIKLNNLIPKLDFQYLKNSNIKTMRLTLDYWRIINKFYTRKDSARDAFDTLVKDMNSNIRQLKIDGVTYIHYDNKEGMELEQQLWRILGRLAYLETLQISLKYVNLSSVKWELVEHLRKKNPDMQVINL